MKNLSLVLAALLLVAGMISTNLWRDLRAERRANAELRLQLAQAAAVAQAAPSLSARAPAAARPVASVPQPLATAASGNGNPVTPPPPPDLELANRAATAAISASAMAAATGSGEQDLLKNPEYRRAQLTMTRLRLAQSNPGLAETLGLSEPEANHLFEVMAEAQLNLTSDLLAATNAPGGSNTNLIGEVMRRGSTSFADPVRATLGEARFEQYQDYQRNLRPALTQVASIGSAMTAAGQPLSEAQSKALGATLIGEMQRQRQEVAVPRPAPVPGTRPSAADTMREIAQRQEENNRRILQAASPHLTGPQLEVLEKMFAQQAAQGQRTLETARRLDARMTTEAPASTP